MDDPYSKDVCFVFKASRIGYVMPSTILYIIYTIYSVKTLRAYNNQSRQTQVVRNMIRCLSIMQTVNIVCMLLMWAVVQGPLGTIIRKKDMKNNEDEARIILLFDFFDICDDGIQFFIQRFN